MPDRCDNDWLLRFVTRLWEVLEPHRAQSYRRSAAAGYFARAEAILAEHDAIVTAFEHGEPPPRGPAPAGRCRRANRA
ncbi:hypothetical protein ACWDBD_43910 [Streptomyces sp. NPDC001118]